MLAMCSEKGDDRGHKTCGIIAEYKRHVMAFVLSWPIDERFWCAQGASTLGGGEGCDGVDMSSGMPSTATAMIYYYAATSRLASSRASSRFARFANLLCRQATRQTPNILPPSSTPSISTRTDMQSLQGRQATRQPDCRPGRMTNAEMCAACKANG